MLTPTHHKMPTTMNYMETQTTTMDNSSYEDYMQALEEERRKIQVFHRELPLSLDLVNKAIENCKQRISSKQEHEQQTSSDVPVLEEFIPFKTSSSLEKKSNDESCKQKIGKNVDWLRSVQLWNSPSQQQDNSPKIKENGGAFLPWATTTRTPAAAETGTLITMTTPSPVPTTSTSSTADNNSHEEKQGLNRKKRRCWSPELHRRFLHALGQLGGSHAATPKQIRDLMKVDGLTNDEVKSHLQKYRLHSRPVPSMNNNVNAQPTQFVVVGGIWVPPQDFTPTTKGDATSTGPERIYVPVASPPQLTRSSQQQQQQQQHKHLLLSTGSSHSEQKSSRAEHSMGDENAHSSSPTATSSSTETTTASPKF